MRRGEEKTAQNEKKNELLKHNQCVRTEYLVQVHSTMYKYIVRTSTRGSRMRYLVLVCTCTKYYEVLVHSTSTLYYVSVCPGPGRQRNFTSDLVLCTSDETQYQYIVQVHLRNKNP